jgi:predicted nucleic acid-binding protein
MERENKSFAISRATFFNGKRQVGLDTNILIKIYEQPYLLNREASRIFNYKDLIFIHARVKFEFIRKLQKKGFNETEAKNEVNNFLREKNINVIYPNQIFITEEEIKNFENNTNQKIKEIDKNDFLKCHFPDSLILLAYKKFGINKIYSTDESFKFGGHLLGINIEGLLSLNKTIKRELGKNTKFSKKKKH